MREGGRRWQRRPNEGRGGGGVSARWREGKERELMGGGEMSQVCKIFSQSDRGSVCVLIGTSYGLSVSVCSQNSSKTMLPGRK